jgi:hypothetical protein
MSWLVAGILANAAGVAMGDLSRPQITQIRVERTNIVVVVQVPAGFAKVSLQSRPRLQTGTWSPRAVMRVSVTNRVAEVRQASFAAFYQAEVSGQGGTVEFRLPKTVDMEMLRVVADVTEPLPSSFFQGTNTFASAAASNQDTLIQNNSADFAAPTAAGTTSSREGTTVETREVVESDIWKRNGDKLYFFNQYRGLQVIDLQNPDAPVLRGSLNLPAAGEQMYLLGAEHVVLLTRQSCYGGYPETNAVLVVNVAGPQPTIAATVPIEGSIQESRMVGTALYVATQTYRPGTNGTWQYGSIVTAIDLAQPAAPVTRGGLWASGYGNVIAATDTYLFVAYRDEASY